MLLNCTNAKFAGRYKNDVQESRIEAIHKGLEEVKKLFDEEWGDIVFNEEYPLLIKVAAKEGKLDIVEFLLENAERSCIEKNELDWEWDEDISNMSKEDMIKKAKEAAKVKRVDFEQVVKEYKEKAIRSLLSRDCELQDKHAQVIKAVVESGLELVIRYRELGYNILSKAICNGNKTIVAQLIEYKEIIDLTNKHDRSLVIDSISTDIFPILESKFSGNPSSFDLKDELKFILSYEEATNPREEFNFLLSIIDPKDDYNELYDVYLDAILHHEDKIEWLLDKCPINIKNSAGFSPLHIAAIYGKIEIAKKLLDKGAILEQEAIHPYRNGVGDRTTPLFNAASNSRSCIENRLAMIRLLIERGANINAKNREGENSLLKLAKSHINEELISTMKLLIELGIDKHIEDKAAIYYVEEKIKHVDACISSNNCYYGSIEYTKKFRDNLQELNNLLEK